MLFDKNDDVRNEKILYQTKPNMLFGCKKAIFGIVILAIVIIVAPRAIQFIGNMQVYLISQINLALTRYAAIAFFVVILFIIIYIIWQLIGWYSKEYIITQSRIIVKSGVLSTKKNYMPYGSIQDINTSQSILEKVFNVGSIYLFSAYDNNQMELSAISNPSEIEDVIFSNVVNYRTYNEPKSYFHENNSFGRNFQNSKKYHERNDYYDEFEPITPIGHEKDRVPRRNYEYYPNDLGYEENSPKKYEYEPYEDKFYNSNRGFDESSKQYVDGFNDSSRGFEESPRQYVDGFNDSSRGFEEPSRQYRDNFNESGVGFEEPSRQYRDNFNESGVGFEEPSRQYVDGFNGSSRGFDESSRQYNNESYYNGVRDDYSYGGDEYYQDNQSENNYTDYVKDNVQEKSKDVDGSSEKVIRRHFDKFKK